MNQLRPARDPMALLIRLAGNLIASASRGNERLCILTYHRVLEAPDPLLPSEVDLATFRWQMKLMARCFNVLPLSEALERMQEQTLPPRAVCVSFDDGYRSVYELALPVLQEFGLPATVFTTTAHIDGGSMWNDRIIEAVRHMPLGPLDLRAIGLDLSAIAGEQDRLATANRLARHAKYLQPDERAQVIAVLEQLAGIRTVPDLMLNREMIASLSRQHMEIGGHTVTHPILGKLADNLARAEIIEGKQTLEAIIGKPLKLFAYPNGKVDVDYDDRHIRMVKEAGFSAAFTTAVGATSRFDARYEIPRSRPWDKTPFMFSLRLLYWLLKKGA
ncbi:polysaccharide deacetylase family protein [Herbaspirillum lusitanum]|uniref:Polysaccharide deacetylase family protein n=1 Tax=Herbaspirillum lusitanum TaxID=213312 RepID=A0ABW9A5G2_9BURK